MSRARARTVRFVIGGVLVSVLGVLFLPVRRAESVSVADAPSPVITAPSPQDGALGLEGYWQIVRENILSASRTGPEMDDAPWLRGVQAAPRQQASSELPRYRLSGLVHGPDGIVALIDADWRVPGAELYRVGDRVGPYRLVEANDSTVVLRGSGGTQVLRIQPAQGEIR